MKYIIMCGGVYPKFTTPKQLLRLQSGETIVGRTIRLLKENGVTDIAISATDPAFEGLGVPVLKHDNTYNLANGTGWWVDGFYPMEEPVCYLFGDVVFSDHAIKKIVHKQTTDIDFFASASPFDSHYIKGYCEPFAFKVENTEKFFGCIEICKKYNELRMFQRHPVAWELWQVCQGAKLNFIARDFTVISDFTCDIDNEKDLVKFNMRVHI